MLKRSRIKQIREELLTEWRGAEEPFNLNSGIHKAENFITSILRQAGLEDGLTENEVLSMWKDLAGDFVSRHAQPQSIKGGHLVLRVTQPALRFQLEQMKSVLMTRITAQLGKGRIKSIKFSLG